MLRFLITVLGHMNQEDLERLFAGAPTLSACADAISDEADWTFLDYAYGCGFRTNLPYYRTGLKKTPFSRVRRECGYRPKQAHFALARAYRFARALERECRALVMAYSNAGAEGEADKWRARWRRAYAFGHFVTRADQWIGGSRFGADIPRPEDYNFHLYPGDVREVA